MARSSLSRSWSQQLDADLWLQWLCPTFCTTLRGLTFNTLLKLFGWLSDAPLVPPPSRNREKSLNMQGSRISTWIRACCLTCLSRTSLFLFLNKKPPNIFSDVAHIPSLLLDVIYSGSYLMLYRVFSPNVFITANKGGHQEPAYSGHLVFLAQVMLRWENLRLKET